MMSLAAEFASNIQLYHDFLDVIIFRVIVQNCLIPESIVIIDAKCNLKMSQMIWDTQLRSLVNWNRKINLFHGLACWSSQRWSIMDILLLWMFTCHWNFKIFHYNPTCFHHKHFFMHAYITNRITIATFLYLLHRFCH